MVCLEFEYVMYIMFHNNCKKHTYLQNVLKLQTIDDIVQFGCSVKFERDDWYQSNDSKICPLTYHDSQKIKAFILWWLHRLCNCIDNGADVPSSDVFRFNEDIMKDILKCKNPEYYGNEESVDDAIRIWSAVYAHILHKYGIKKLNRCEWERCMNRYLSMYYTL